MSKVINNAFMWLGEQRARVKKAAATQKALTVAEFLRPEIAHSAPPYLRRAAEVVIATAALSILLSLFAAALSSFATLFFALALAYLILTHVFGLQLNLAA